MEGMPRNIGRVKEIEPGIRVLEAPGIVKPEEVMAIIEAQHDVKVVHSNESFPDEEHYEVFGEIPAIARKALRRASLGARDYLSGFIMLDNREKEERDTWEQGLQERFGDDFNLVYGKSQLRLAAISRVLSPLLAAQHMLRENKTNGDFKEALRILDTLLAQVPTSLLPDQGDPDMRPYKLLSLEEKLQVVDGVLKLSRAYLSLLTIPAAQK